MRVVAKPWRNRRRFRGRYCATARSSSRLRAAVFLVPYMVIPDEDERRVADYSLKKIVAKLGAGNGAV